LQMQQGHITRNGQILLKSFDPCERF
jgi:hypothetical protein